MEKLQSPFDQSATDPSPLGIRNDSQRSQDRNRPRVRGPFQPCRGEQDMPDRTIALMGQQGQSGLRTGIAQQCANQFSLRLIAERRALHEQHIRSVRFRRLFYVHATSKSPVMTAMVPILVQPGRACDAGVPAGTPRHGDTGVHLAGV